MPLYEYVCEADGSVVELLRPMSQADEPVEDPQGKGRRFVRRQSTFAASSSGGATGSSLPIGGCCPCGKSGSACARAS